MEVTALTYCPCGSYESLRDASLFSLGKCALISEAFTIFSGIADPTK